MKEPGEGRTGVAFSHGLEHVSQKWDGTGAAHAPLAAIMAWAFPAIEWVSVF